MLERTEEAGHLLRPASLLAALRERTRELHIQAERSGFIADMLHGRASRHGYVLMLQNLLPVYRTLETQLAKHAEGLRAAGVRRRAGAHGRRRARRSL